MVFRCFSSIFLFTRSISRLFIILFLLRSIFCFVFTLACRCGIFSYFLMVVFFVSFGQMGTILHSFYLVICCWIVEKFSVIIITTCYYYFYCYYCYYRRCCGDGAESCIGPRRRFRHSSRVPEAVHEPPGVTRVLRGVGLVLFTSWGVVTVAASCLRHGAPKPHVMLV